MCLNSLHRAGQGKQCSLESHIKREPITSLGWDRAPSCIAFTRHISDMLELLEVRLGLTQPGLFIGPQPSPDQVAMMTQMSHGATSPPGQ